MNIEIFKILFPLVFFFSATSNHYFCAKMPLNIQKCPQVAKSLHSRGYMLQDRTA
jgi:hypothetical protein